MNKKSLRQKSKEHLLKTVGKKPTKKEMIEIERKIKIAYDKIYNKPDKEESVMKKIYNKELSRHWGRVVANENFAKEVTSLLKYTNVKTNSHVASFASGLAVYELFLARELVPQGKVYCIDISEGMNKVARKFAKRLNQNNIKIITGSVTKIPLKSNTQDIVMARRTGLSKDKKWIDILKEAYRIIKKNKESTFLYTVDKVFNDSIQEIKSNLNKAKFRFVTMKDSHSSNEGIVCMIITKPIF
jgi:ubiquinone/menaquinone biosynthesis C-methylase UbiE